MRKPKRVTFKVSFNLPVEARVSDARDYVADAISSWAGSLRPPYAYGEGDNTPGDPMFFLDRDSIRVCQMRKVPKLE